MTDRPHQPHDRYFRSAFSLREIMVEYVREFLPPELVGQMELDSLTQQKDSFLDKNLEQYFSDVVYTVNYGPSRVIVTVLLEHKSYVPLYPWLQLLQYMVNAFAAQARQKGFSGRFRPVIPIVVYHGDQQWNIRQVASYFDGMDDFLKQFIPEFRYHLTDLTQLSPEHLRKGRGKLVSRTFLTLKYSSIQNEMERTRLVIRELLEADLHEDHLNFFQLTIVYLTKIGLSKEAMMRSVDQVETGKKDMVLSVYDQLIMEGKHKGRLEERERNQFQVFKKGIPKGLSMADLMDLTEVDEPTAKHWMKLLTENPDSELPAVNV